MVKNISKETPKNPQFTPVNDSKRHKFNVFFDKIGKNQELKTELKAGRDTILDILLSGLLISLALLIFNLPFSIIGIVSYGSSFWFISNKIMPILKGLLTSFRLVEIK